MIIRVQPSEGQGKVGKTFKDTYLASCHDPISVLQSY